MDHFVAIGRCRLRFRGRSALGKRDLLIERSVRHCGEFYQAFWPPDGIERSKQPFFAFSL